MMKAANGYREKRESGKFCMVRGGACKLMLLKTWSLLSEDPSSVKSFHSQVIAQLDSRYTLTEEAVNKAIQVVINRYNTRIRKNRYGK